MLVAVADFEQSVVAKAREMLGQYGYDISMVVTGAQVLENVVAEQASLLIIDALLPDMDHHQMMKHLGGMSNQDRPGVIVLFPKDYHLGLQERAADMYLSKNCHPQELLTFVKHVITPAGTRYEKKWYPDEKIRALVKGISAKNVSSMLLDFPGDPPVKFNDPGLIEVFLDALHNAMTGEPILLLPKNSLVIYVKSVLGVQKPVRIWIDPTPGPLFDEALSTLARHHAAEAREKAAQCAANVQSVTLSVWRFSKHVTEPAEVAHIVEALQQIDERAFALPGQECYLKLHLPDGKAEEVVLKIHTFWTALQMVHRPEPNFPEPIWKHCLPLIEQQWQYIREAKERQDQQHKSKRQ